MEAKRGPARGEAIFEGAYLCIGAAIGIYLLMTGGSAWKQLYGIMALVLVGGDAFHLVPRMRAGLSNDRGRFTAQLGVGKLVTSITMTIFYVLLWNIGLMLFSGAQIVSWTWVVYGLAVVRIALCLFPQNRWKTDDGPQRWNIIRNVPFLLLGILVLLLFLLNASASPFGSMWVAIALSYAFYIPVVLGSRKYPMLGMLMLPKTCMYLWILFIGLFS